MSYGSLLQCLPPHIKQLVRKYENKSKAYLKEKWSLGFNKICIQEGLLPTHTRFKLDPEAASTEQTRQYRMYLIEREIRKLEDKLNTLEKEKELCLSDLEKSNCDREQLNNVLSALKIILGGSDRANKAKILKKLNWLYHGRTVKAKFLQFCINDNRDSFVNLSSYALTQDEIRFLNLGMNCHLTPKYSKIFKKIELEILYRNLLDLNSEGKILVSPDLSNLLSAEGTKHRNTKTKTIITPELRTAATNLKNNEDISIRKADKSATYVILNREDYLSKIDTILADETKFKIVHKNPINDVKRRVNKLVETQNAMQESLKLPKIVGDFQPGYLYGNVKTHKVGNPLRPIISQIPSPTYKLAKIINNIITPYTPNNFSLKSSDEFLDLLHSNPNEGIIASLDVQSLFTHVPILETINIIISRVYNHPDLPPPKIPKHILEELLVCCTKEVPFRCPRGNMYVQIEGVAMGSPLGPCFANFYMGHIENIVLNDLGMKPSIYGRYVDDIFVQITDESQLINLKNAFENNSVLNFTYEMNINNKLPFLDILVDSSGNEFRTEVYHKPTDQGACLNFRSECIERYKQGTVHCYLNRAYKTASTWQEFNTEVCHIKQKLVNNNYPNHFVDQHIRKFLNNVILNKTKEKKPSIPIYYKAQFHQNYKLDERVIKNILNNKIKSNCDSEIQIRIYYQGSKTCNLVMKNNLNPKPSGLSEANIIYKFECPELHGQATCYVGATQTTLSRRLTAHKQHGSICEHYLRFHGTKPTREQLVENTVAIARAPDKQRLYITEALLILNEKPIINKQQDGFPNILKLYSNLGEVPYPTQDISPITLSNTRTLNNDDRSPSPLDDIRFLFEEKLEGTEILVSQRTFRLLNSPINLNKIVPPNDEPTVDEHMFESNNGNIADGRQYHLIATPQTAISNSLNLFPSCSPPKEPPTQDLTLQGIPDMQEVLKNFGLDVKRFEGGGGEGEKVGEIGRENRTFDLETHFSVNHTPNTTQNLQPEELITQCETPESLTISQRIKTLVRNARYGRTHFTEDSE